MNNNKTKLPEKNQSRVINSLKKTYKRFLKIRGNPHEIAIGLALGLFVGMTPTMGFHTAIAVFFAALLKWNKISAAIGVWVTNPLTAPLIYPINYLVGIKLAGFPKANGSIKNLDWPAFYQLVLKTPEIFWALIIGGVILGIPLALAGYYFSYSVIQRYQDDIKKKLARSKEKLALKKAIRKEKKILKQKEKIKAAAGSQVFDE